MGRDGRLAGALELGAEAEVARVAQARNDVFMLVEHRVDDRAPEGGIGWHVLLQVVDSLRSSKCTNEMQTGWSAMGEKCFVGNFHGEACSQHWVHEDEGFVLDRRCCEVLGYDLELLYATASDSLLAIGADKGVFCMVEHIEEALVERQSSAKDGAEYDFILRHLHIGNSQRRLDGFLGVGKLFADLERHDFADAFDVASEAHAVLLNVHRTQFFEVLIEQRRLLG